MKRNKIKMNKIKCKLCGDVIESGFTHDFKFCACRSVAVDGGHEYLRRCGEIENWEELSEVYEEDGEKQVKEMDFYESFVFLMHHPSFRGTFLRQLDIDVAKVNPETMCVDADPKKNTHTRVWLECGIPDDDDDVNMIFHDIELDCGGDTFEFAIIQLAEKVQRIYGDYKVPRHI